MGRSDCCSDLKMIFQWLQIEKLDNSLVKPIKLRLIQTFGEALVEETKIIGTICISHPSPQANSCKCFVSFHVFLVSEELSS